MVGALVGNVGVVQGLWEPFTQARDGVLVVENCRHHEGERAKKECEGSFVSTDRKITDSYAAVPTDTEYAPGDRIPVLKADERTYAVSLVSAVAAGLQPFFVGLLILLLAGFLLLTARWPAGRYLAVLTTLPAGVRKTFYFGAGIGVLGFLTCSLIKWSAG